MTRIYRSAGPWATAAEAGSAAALPIRSADPKHAGCASSQHYLPSAALPPLDLVLIDGAHAFPAPFLDWFYTAEPLKVGGLMVVLRDNRFAVYRKRVHPMADERDWLAQAYLVKSYPVAAVRVIKAGPLRRVLGLARAAWNEPELVRRKLRTRRGRPRH